MSVLSPLAFISPPEAALFALFALGYLIPPVLIAVLIWKRSTWHPKIPDWRWRIWNVGLFVLTAVAVAAPIFLAGIQFLPESAKNKWFIDIGSRQMVFAFVASPIAIICLGFGKGTQRVLGMSAAGIASAMLFISLLSLSY